MHLLETRYQREWADEQYPDGIVNWRTSHLAPSPRAENIEAPHSKDFFNAMYQESYADLELQRDTMQTHSLGQDPSQLANTDHLTRVTENAH